MNWGDIPLFYACYYPFYDYAFALQGPPHHPPIATSLLLQNDSKISDCVEIIKSCDTQQPLKLARGESKTNVDLKRKMLRKQKLVKKRDRQDNFERKKQKKDRNLPSNIFKYFITYIYSHPSLHHFFSALKKHQVYLQPQAFIQKIKGSINQTQSYIRPAIIQKLCGQQILNRQQSLAFRMLLKRFLLLELPIIVGPMEKYKRREKRELFKLGRKLLEQIQAKFYQ